jgi:membrane protease subunit HflC
MNRFTIAIIAVLGVIVVVGSMSFFTVRQDRQALVLEFGEPKRVIQQPGLNFKLPWQNVEYFDRRLMVFDAQPQEATMLDQRRMLTDAYVVYRIIDPLAYLRTVQTEARLRARLDAITGDALRGVLGQVPFQAMFTQQRLEVMRRVTEVIRDETRPFGIEVVEARITRTDVPTSNAPAIFARMQTERQREANQERATGAETATRIRAEAERDRTVLLADATRQSAELRGGGDAEVTRILADSYSRGSEFFAFWRSLQAYRLALGDGGSTMVLTPDSDFFRFFRDMRGNGAHGNESAPGVPRN